MSARKKWSDLSPAERRRVLSPAERKFAGLLKTGYETRRRKLDEAADRRREG